MSRLNPFFFGVMVPFCLGISVSLVNAQEPSLTGILASTPERPNAILYVDVPAIRKLTAGSPLSSDLSEKLGEVRIAADLNIKMLQSTWEIGFVTTNGAPLDAQSLATATSGYVDTIGGRSVVWTQRQSYLIPLSKGVLGIVRPADRKLVGRWLKNEKSGSVADFLKKQAMQDTKFLSVLLAVDLEDNFSTIGIEQRIATLDSLKGTDLKSIAGVLSTVKGIKVIVGRKNLDECIISMEFGSSPASLLPVANPFFAEVLARNGSSIPEASTWKASVDGNTLSFRGSITAGTIDDLLGIFLLHQQASSIPVTSDTAKTTQDPSVNSTSESGKLEITKSYFDKTAGIIKRVRDYSADNTGDRAQWNSRMARRIDDLPTLNVDPDVLEFGAKISEGLRGNAVALQQTNISYYAAAVANGAGTINVGFNGGYYVDANAPYQYRGVAQAQGNYSYRQLIADMDQLLADTRRKLTDKYQVQF